MKSIIFGLFSSLFFSLSFILNRQMSINGGSWIWSSSLRFLFMLPIFIIIVFYRGGLTPLLLSIKSKFLEWLIWSTIGFGVFYSTLCFAANFGPGWLIASSWQITIVAGALMSPFFFKTVFKDNKKHLIRETIPKKNLIISLIILIGVFLLQIDQVSKIGFKDTTFGILFVLIGAFAYPLGNRKMMALCAGSLDVYQRILGMIICSLPFWILLILFEYFRNGAPEKNQIYSSLIVAISSGVIATILFFKGTELVKDDMKKLAIVEATQAGEVIFSLLGEIIFLGELLPSLYSSIGILIIISGLIIQSLFFNSSNNLEKKLSFD